jgi:hypothetical protein
MMLDTIATAIAPNVQTQPVHLFMVKLLLRGCMEVRHRR